MTINLSRIANSALDQMFASLDGILARAEAAAKEKGVEESVFLNWRLAPNMFPLEFQLRVATELPARTLSRLSGAEMPEFADDEKTFADYRARIKKAREHIKSLPEDAINVEPDAPITFPAGPDSEMTLPRSAYVQNFILPNVYFHVTAAYLILRQLGVDLGKRDFLAVPQS